MPCSSALWRKLSSSLSAKGVKQKYKKPRNLTQGVDAGLSSMPGRGLELTVERLIAREVRGYTEWYAKGLCDVYSGYWPVPAMAVQSDGQIRPGDDAGAGG